jgi:hypothetical protein
MNDTSTAEIPTSASIASLAIALTLAALCLFGWRSTNHLHLLLGGLGFAIVSPIWYLSPIRWRGFFGPKGSWVTYHRTFGPWAGLQSLIGYACIAAAIVLWLWRLLGLLRV